MHIAGKSNEIQTNSVILSNNESIEIINQTKHNSANTYCSTI